MLLCLINCRFIIITIIIIIIKAEMYPHVPGEQSSSSLFYFTDHTVPFTRNTVCPISNFRDLVDQWSHIPTDTVVEQAASVDAVASAMSVHSL